MEWHHQIPAYSADPSDPCDNIIRAPALPPLQPITAAYVRPSGALINAGGRAQAITYDGLEEDAIAGGARGAFSPTFSSAASSSSSSRDSAAKKRQRDQKDAARAEKDAAKAAAKEAAKEAAREAAAKEAAAKEAAAKEAAKDSTK